MMMKIHAGVSSYGFSTANGAVGRIRGVEKIFYPPAYPSPSRPLSLHLSVSARISSGLSQWGSYFWPQHLPRNLREIAWTFPLGFVDWTWVRTGAWIFLTPSHWALVLASIFPGWDLQRVYAQLYLVIPSNSLKDSA